jgi:hypothetical protein
MNEVDGSIVRNYFMRIFLFENKDHIGIVEEVKP